MKITEKLYITRLEKMIKRHRGDPCPYCPMCKNYTPNKAGDEMFGGGICDGYEHAGCQICMRLTETYASVECVESITDGWCPCNYFAEYFDGTFDAMKRKAMPEDYMVKVAWKMIRGWKKDNKQEV